MNAFCVIDAERHGAGQRAPKAALLRVVLRALAVCALLITGVATSISISSTDASAAPERRVALVISNSRYENTPALSNPPVDAEAIYSTLKAMSFQDVDVLHDVAADELRKRLRDFALKARLADVALIYYAGHGLEADGQNYMVPIDARLETDLDIAFETVSIDLAVRAVNGAKRLKLLILDACRDNPLAAGAKSDGKSRSFGTGLAPIETAGDVLVSYAAAAGQVAQDGPPGTNSPFARALSQHLRTPGVDVRQVLGRVRDSVAEATRDRQKPFIYASLGGGPIYLIPPPDQPPPPSSPVVIDLTVADPEEEPVKAFLGDENTQFKFRYDLVQKPGAAKAAEIRPNLDYFISAAERGRPLLQAAKIGYFSPDEMTLWSVSYPLIDIVARRNEPRVVTLSEMQVEVEQSVADSAPHFALATSASDFAKLVIVNEGWSDVRQATVEYDVVGFDKPTRADVVARVTAKKNGGYTYRASIGPFEDFAFISLNEGLSKALPDFPMYAYAFKNQPQDFDANGRPTKLPTSGAPRGYAAWVRANPKIFDFSKQGEGLWIVGRITLEPARPNVPPVVADFFAPVTIYPPEGLGGGSIGYNLKDRIALRTDGVRYTVKKPIGYLLDQDTKTFRGLYPLIAQETSRHRLRFSLKGDGGRDLWVSDWMDVHVVVPRASKKSAEWARAGAKGRPPLKGLP